MYTAQITIEIESSRLALKIVNENNNGPNLLILDESAVSGERF